jgi:hypothetical protein
MDDEGRWMDRSGRWKVNGGARPRLRKLTHDQGYEAPKADCRWRGGWVALMAEKGLAQGLICLRRNLVMVASRSKQRRA